MFRLTLHAQDRLSERSIDDDALAAALAGREMDFDEQVYYYDRHSRTLVVVEDAAIVTCYKMTKRDVKRRLSR